MNEGMPPPFGFQVAPGLAESLSSLPVLDLNDIDSTRRLLAVPASVLAEPTPGVRWQRVEVGAGSLPAPGGTVTPADLTLLVYVPEERRRAGAILDIHGGGFVVGSAAGQHTWNVRMCRDLGVVVASVEYRLAPEHPFPAALVDCDRAFSWLVDHSGLEVDRDQVAVVGSSAGACLAAGMTLWRRDRGLATPSFQYLAIPVLDDRLDSPSMVEFTNTPVWDRSLAKRSWELYLTDALPDLLPYAAPARREDLAGMPETYISVMQFDPLRDEGIDFATKLLRAGVTTELHLFPGSFHTSHRIEGADVSARDWAERVCVLGTALDRLRD